MALRPASLPYRPPSASHALDGDFCSTPALAMNVHAHTHSPQRSDVVDRFAWIFATPFVQVQAGEGVVMVEPIWSEEGGWDGR